MSDPASVNEVPRDAGNVTQLLLKWGSGDSSALERLTPIIYEDLLRLARIRLSRESRALTLQPTALVHECYLRLADQTRLQWQNRAHFYAVAANTMRRVLIDEARARRNGRSIVFFHLEPFHQPARIPGQLPSCIHSDPENGRSPLIPQLRGKRTRMAEDLPRAARALFRVCLGNPDRAFPPTPRYGSDTKSRTAR